MRAFQKLKHGVLWVLLGSACGNHVPNFINNNGLPHYNLTDLIKDSILTPYANICQGNTLNGGFMTLENHSEIILDNATINSPVILIRCSDSNDSSDSSLIFTDFLDLLNEYSVVDDSRRYLAKDSFSQSVLMITFVSCAVCIGCWMVYLVITLLPAENHNGRRFSVQFYVLFTAIYEAAMLCKSVRVIFKKQYEANKQDSFDFERFIILTTAHRVGEIMSSWMNFLNWTAIIYYMFHNYRKLHKNWLPSALSNRNNLIVYIGGILTITDTVLLGVTLWTRGVYSAVSIAYRIIDYIIYSLFCGLTVYFIGHNFCFVLAPKRIQSTEHAGFKSILILIWKDYHETIPLLFYNSALFVLLYFTSIYLTVIGIEIGQWYYKIVKFFRLIITVSVWGLIDVLERRELILSRETILGKKIHNNDEYFFDPKLPYGHTSLEETRSGLSSVPSNSSNSALMDPHNESDKLKWPRVILKHPSKVWKSQVTKAKTLKKYSRTKSRKLLNSLAGSNNQLDGSHISKRKTVGRSSICGRELAPSASANYTVFRISDIDNENQNDAASMETELARNYIYDYNHGHI